MFRLEKKKDNVIKDEVFETGIKPIRVGNAFSSSYIEYKSNRDKVKFYQLKNILMKLNHN